jgi:hypothetical protein
MTMHVLILSRQWHSSRSTGTEGARICAVPLKLNLTLDVLSNSLVSADFLLKFSRQEYSQLAGLHTLAVTHYERVLKLAEKQRSDVRIRDRLTLRILTMLSLFEDDCLAKEAAYNLSQIFVTTGATPLAEALYRQWLSI